MNNLNYEQKYLKYKNKYFRSKNIKNINKIGGTFIKAIAYFNAIIKGTVKFEEISNDEVIVIIDLTGFVPNTIHGFHVHESGDLTEGCKSMCAHFNPYGKNHGKRENNIDNRHVGDLGNIYADINGQVKIQFIDKIIKLSGNSANIIGRGLIIHEDEDDCGEGIGIKATSSKENGNAGIRIACAIIGYASVCKH